MDEEHTAGYREPCAQCSAVDWGISDECHFYCRSCHNIIEKTTEVVDPTFNRGSARITTISRGSDSKRSEDGKWEWMICEAFQFILMKQADALLRLGVREEFKDKILCELWRLYLQKRNLAFTHTPAKRSTRCLGSDSDSAPESSIMSFSQMDAETDASSAHASSQGDGAERLVWSGSVDAASYLKGSMRWGWSCSSLSMKTTLALIHIGLTWIREPLTLSDLLRFAKEGHIPYINAYETLPEEMKLHGRDAIIFRVERIPSYHCVHEDAQTIIQLLELPAFPPISRQCLLHPVLLSLRYLTDANLPDDLHPWLCRLIEGADMADHKFHTFNPESCPVLPKYDLQTAALIVITMKLFFGLNDQTEWDLTSDAQNQNDSGNVFSLFHWYKLLQASLVRAQNRGDRDMARKQWKSKKPLCAIKNEKCRILKKRRVAEQLQLCFEKLSSRPAVAEPAAPSSFRFCWGEEDGADGPSMHLKKLTGLVTTTNFLLKLSNPTYWQPVLRPCSSWRTRNKRTLYPKVEPILPRTYVWLLGLFSFLLDVKPWYLYEEVLSVERQIFNCRHGKKKKAKPSRIRRTRTRTRIRTRTRTRTRTEAQPRAPQKE